LRKELALCHFYLSCTEIGSLSAESHWRVFGEGDTGFRLRLRLTPAIAELRRIRYGSSPTPSLLSAVDADLLKRLKRTFLPQGVSRVAAFSLGRNLAYEDELRLLVSNPPTDWIKSDNEDSYITLPFDMNHSVCRVDLLGITCAQAADEPKIRQLAAQNGFSALAIDARVP
jgi:hypothetical protein